jgi:hypothetical protein
MIAAAGNRAAVETAIGTQADAAPDRALPWGRRIHVRARRLGQVILLAILAGGGWSSSRFTAHYSEKLASRDTREPYAKPAFLEGQ